MNSLMAYSARVSTIRKQVRGAMEIAVFIQNIQEERAEVALYIFLNNSNANFSMSEVLSNNNRYLGERGDLSMRRETERMFQSGDTGEVQ